MKRYQVAMSICFTFMLSACATAPVKEETVEQEEEESIVQEVKEETKPKEEVETELENKEELVEEKSESTPSQTITTTEQVNEIILDYGLGENDQLVDVVFADGKIKSTITLNEKPSTPLPTELIATSSYSQITDELLKYDGWTDITITYTNIGTVSMNVNQQQDNGYGGMYFPTQEIEKQLGVTY